MLTKKGLSSIYNKSDIVKVLDQDNQIKVKA